MSANFLDGFDAWMENRNPGHKASVAAEKAARETASRTRREASIARHGSLDAAMAPCERERLLRASVDAWVVSQSAPHQRWTRSVDGYTGFLDKPSDRVVKALSDAYPLPTTFREALAEHRHWQERRRELEDLLGPEAGDDPLDPPVQIRAAMVRDLAEKELVVDTLLDLRDRFALYREYEFDDRKIEDALFRDLDAMVRAAAAD